MVKIVILGGLLNTTARNLVKKWPIMGVNFQVSKTGKPARFRSQLHSCFLKPSKNFLWKDYVLICIHQPYKYPTCVLKSRTRKRFDIREISIPFFFRNEQNDFERFCSSRMRICKIITIPSTTWKT